RTGLTRLEKLAPGVFPRDERDAFARGLGWRNHARRSFRVSEAAPGWVREPLHEERDHPGRERGPQRRLDRRRRELEEPVDRPRAAHAPMRLEWRFASNH